MQRLAGETGLLVREVEGAPPCPAPPGPVSIGTVSIDQGGLPDIVPTLGTLFGRVACGDLLEAPVISRNPLLVAAAATRDPGRHDRRAEAVVLRARRIVRLLVASLALPGEVGRARDALEAETIAEGVALAYGLRSTPRVRGAIDQALILMADHELNASAFAARVAASTHADVYAAVQAGLATLSGPLHGAVSDQVEAVVAEIGRPEEALRVVHARAQRGERVPGFGHSFYQGIDPRAHRLLTLADALASRSRELRVVQSLVDAMAKQDRPPPNVDVGIVALRASLGMPVGAGAGLFAIGRTAGWVAHVLEQYESGHLLRPRARYRGVPVPADEDEDEE